MSFDDLSKVEILRAASNSKNKAVRIAYDKLKFAITLAHTEEELDELAAGDIYHLRISRKTPDGGEYENILIRWMEDEFVIYAPSEQGTIAGRGHKLDKDPAIVYLKHTPKKSNDITEELTKAAKACYGRLGR